MAAAGGGGGGGGGANASSSSNNSSAHPLNLKLKKEEQEQEDLKPKKEEQDVSTEITTAPVDVKPKIRNSSSQEEIEKFQRYEAEFSSYLMSKYFSDKNIYGGNIFDTKMTTDGGTIKASRLPPYASFADPAKFWELMQEESSAEAESAATTSNGNHAAKKSD